MNQEEADQDVADVARPRADMYAAVLVPTVSSLRAPAHVLAALTNILDKKYNSWY